MGDSVDVATISRAEHRAQHCRPFLDASASKADNEDDPHCHHPLGRPTSWSRQMTGRQLTRNDYFAAWFSA